MASRHGRALFMLFEDDDEYYQKIKAIFGSSLLAYWQQDEKTGTVAKDSSVNEYNAAYVNATLASIVGPSGKRIPLYGTGDSACLDLKTEALQLAFSSEEGTLGLFIKAEDAGMWTAAGETTLLNITAATFSDNIRLWLSNGDGTAPIFWLNGNGSGIASGATLTITGSEMGYPLGWMSIIFSWSKTNDTLKLFVNGDLKSSTTLWPDWTFTVPQQMFLMTYAQGNQHFGCYSDTAFMLNKEITAIEARKVVDVSHIHFDRITALGDSITVNQSWVYEFRGNHNNGSNVLKNRAGNGETIMAHMDAQVVAAANDDADIIIIELGTNDDNAGNMATLQAEVEENIAELKISNPRATIYWMNVLPYWTDVGGGTVVDKSNIRTAIAAACTAQGITCWDTFTDPWIVVADTVDGLHPTTAGHAKIAARVLALLP